MNVPSTGVRMVLGVFVTLLAVFAILMILAVAGMTSCYAGRVPSGADAMGLIVPLLMSIFCAIAMLVATWCCIGTGGLGWISDRAGVVILVATGVTLGVSLASSGVLLAWMERMGGWTGPAGFLFGLLAPLATCGLLIACAWIPVEKTNVSPIPRLIGWPLAAVAIAGLGAGIYGLGLWAKSSADNARRVAEAQAADDAEWERRRNRAPLDALKEDYAEMSPATPLWVFVAALPDTTDADCRAFTIQRALQVPDFDRDLTGTITCGTPRYRHGCLDLIRFASDTQFQPTWSAAVASSIRVTADEIRAQSDWFTPDHLPNPDPIEHIRALAAAAKRCETDPQVGEAMKSLRRSVEALPASDARTRAIAALDEAQS